MAVSVFVSGATGFIAQHICKLLIEKGYKVVGTVRSKDKGEHLSKLLGTESFSYEIVPDVEPAGAFDEALKKHPEVTVFLHTASPFHFKSSNAEEDLLKPAVNGTKNALAAIQKYGSAVQKVVITSSYAAIASAESVNDPSITNNEESWNNITWEDAKKDAFAGYRGSKTFAEKAAWEFVAQEKPHFTVNYVNPSFVFGPQAFDSEVKDELNTSSEIINSFLKLTPESPVPGFKGGFVDVRDVAKAHLVAFEKDLNNQRLLLFTSKCAAQDVLDILNDNFESLRARLPKGEPGSGKKVTDGMCKVDMSKTQAILGFPLIDLKTSIVDSVAQILNAKKKSHV